MNIPMEWGPGQPLRISGGTVWRVPNRGGDGIRIMPGNPADPGVADTPVKAGPYCRVNKGGNLSAHIPLEGNPVLIDEQKADDMVEPTDDQFLVFGLATEGYEELWTVVAELHNLHPNNSDEELRQRASRTIKSLLEKDSFVICHCSARENGTYELISSDQADEVLAEPANWQAPAEDNAAFYCYVATDDGWKAYEENGRT